MDKIKRYALEIGSYFNEVNANYCKDKCPFHPTTPQGCCEGCGQCNGYFEFRTMGSVYYYNRYLLQIKEAMEELKPLQDKYEWAKKLGFFDMKRKRCRLPREKRSYTCLKYACSGIQALLKVRKMNRIRKLCSKIHDIREKKGILI